VTRGRCAVAVLALAAIACGSPPPSAPPAAITLRLATGPEGGVYQQLGAALATAYGVEIPGVTVQTQNTEGSTSNADGVHTGKYDLAFIQADALYDAFWNGTPNDRSPHSNLRALAVLHMDVLQIVTRRDGPVRRIVDLAGRRVGVGLRGGHTEVSAEKVLGVHGVPLATVRTEPLHFNEAYRRLAAGTLDADIMMVGYPAPAVPQAGDGPPLRLLSLSSPMVARLRKNVPSYRSVEIPARTYPGQGEAVQTIGVESVLVCRAGLDTRLVRRMTEVVIDSIPKLEQAHAAARDIDPEWASAAPIDLHQGAAQFYLDRELRR
jgi:uncharacterized protein